MYDIVMVSIIIVCLIILLIIVVRACFESSKSIPTPSSISAEEAKQLVAEEEKKVQALYNKIVSPNFYLPRTMSFIYKQIEDNSRKGLAYCSLNFSRLEGDFSRHYICKDLNLSPNEWGYLYNVRSINISKAIINKISLELISKGFEVAIYKGGLTDSHFIIKW